MILGRVKQVFFHRILHSGPKVAAPKSLVALVRRNRQDDNAAESLELGPVENKRVQTL